MAAITPNSELYLLKCPLEIDNNHQLTFSSVTAQTNYFKSLEKNIHLEDDEYSYIRHDNIIRVNAHIDTLLNYNYVMYKNTNYSNKWFYAFIVKMEYLNDNCTAITIKTDVWQTWQFDLTFRKCFVEREHVNDDTVGANTIPENFELGEYVCNSKDEITYADVGSNYHRVFVAFVVTKVDLGNGNILPSATYNVHNGIPQGCSVFGFPLDEDHVGYIPFITGAYDSAGAGNAIVSIFLAPEDINPWTIKRGQGIFDTDEYYVPVDSWNASAAASPFQIQQPLTFENYTPVNKKLYTAPFNYFHISNHLGSDVSFAYEDFRGTPAFRIFGAFSQGCSIRAIPMNSKKGDVNNNSFNYDEGVIGGALPQLSWSSDYYLNWQAVNAKNIEVQTTLNAVNFASNIIGNLAGAGFNNAVMRDTAVQRGYFPDEERMHSPNAGGMAGNVLGFASDVANTLQQVKEAKMTPPQVKGNTCQGDLAFSMKHYSFEYFCMSIKAEYAKKIDDYWSAYGYKVTSYKVPNITGRQNWNYVQTKDVNILADIPQGDLAEIKSYFDRGITLWHNPNTFLDYTQSNNIV